VDNERYNPLRDLIAFLVIAAACPIAVWGGAILGCLGQGFNASCAVTVISPAILLGAGIIAGLVTSGWTGLLVGFVGNLAGMVLILVLSFGVNEPVPLDPISGLIAMFWFGVPSLTGYGLGRLAWRLYGMRRGTSA